MRSADYIVVGGGSAGSVAGARLSEDPGHDILLLEEGPADRALAIHLPVMVYKTATGNLLARYEQEPTPGIPKAEKPVMVQARVLGGGSSVNAMLYLRGLPSDFDGWAAAGAEGWAWADVLPHYLVAEDNCTLAGPLHHRDGPLHVSYPEHVSPLSRVWLQAAQQAGMPFRSDFNGGGQEGCGFYQMTLRNGRRASAATCYLHPARTRRNLTVATGCRVTKVLVEEGRATGVEYVEHGRKRRALARREVIVTAGAIATPKLLMLSGIGPGAHLQAMGIPVVRDLPGVGRNLADHMDVYLIYALAGPHGYDRYKRLHWKAWAGLQYALFRNGPVASNVIEAGGFARSCPVEPEPDLQFAFLAGSGVEEGVQPVAGGHGCTLNVCQTRPRSRGLVELRAPDPAAPPRILPNYLADPHDLDTMARGVQMGQEIMRQPALAPYLGAEQHPGRPMPGFQDYRDYVKEMAQGALHPTGTCRIGDVVDTRLRLRGVEGLRIADASVLPGPPSGNTNGPALMLGERLAEFIRNPGA